MKIESSKTTGENKAVDDPTDGLTELPEIVLNPVLADHDGWQITKPLGQCMLQLYDTHIWTDVVFRCEDQCKEDLDDRIRAHRIVLAARSPVFQAIFYGPCQDNDAEMELKDVESDQFEMFLRLMYSDDLDLYDQYDELVGIFELAHKYQVQVIVDGCCRKLGDQVSVDNACDLLDKALLYDNEHLIRVVGDFVDRNAEKVLVSDGFLNLSLRCLTYILKGNTFYAKEADVFNRTIEWAKQRCESHDGQTIRQTLGEAFYFLRTPSMTNVDFLLCTKKKGYYSLDEHEDIIDIIANYKTTQLETICNSKTARCPFEFTLERVPESTDPLMCVGHERGLSENVTLISNDDIYLTGIRLATYTSGYCRYTCMDTFFPNREGDVVLSSLHLSVKICIDYDIENTFNFTIISGNHSSDIRLMKPIHLYAGKSYILKVTVTQNMVEKLYLRAFRCSDTVSFDGIGSDKVCAASKSQGAIFGGNPKVIESLTFKCKSNRN